MSGTGGFPCSNCGAHLIVDGSTPAPTCMFCHTQTVLPREVWEQFHPAPQVVAAPLVTMGTPIPRSRSKAPLIVWIVVASVVAGVVGIIGVGIAILVAAVPSPPGRGVAKSGGSCDGRAAACTKDKKSELTCGADGKLVATAACKGPNGCQISPNGADLTCDSTIADAKDPCNADSAACSTDRKSELHCVAGHFAVAGTCKGENGCTVTGTTLSCDDHIADVGDPCFDVDRTACSSDHKSLLACVGQRFAIHSACKGADACSVRKIIGTKNASINCDESIAEVGESCEGGTGACSVNGKELLTCQNGKLAVEKKCPRNCAVTANSPACR